ncbi:MAG: hypothetical protein KatS3mg094_010 [Candidatus Parcubacteria bacterium]|nr:MAG: hypothetical protein KatS3mg094_010 [Candidatus Parcubacteria bacterium]
MVEDISKPDRDKKAEDLRKLGFSKEEAIKYLSAKFTLETLKQKINSLQSAGFSNPVKLIEEHPQIAGLDITRVKMRLKLIDRLNRKFNLNYDPYSIVEKFHNI